jgi:hypothetical protein
MRKLYADVPQELVDVMNQINFPVIPEAEQVKLLDQLKTWVESDLVKKRYLRPRKKPAEYGKFMTRQSVPDAAFDLLNAYDYSNPVIKSKVARIQMRGKAIEYLQSISIPLYPAASLKRSPAAI